MDGLEFITMVVLILHEKHNMTYMQHFNHNLT